MDSIVNEQPIEEPLSASVVESLIKVEHARAVDLFPRWVHPFSGFAFSRSSRCFGQAHADGRLVISNKFLDTHAKDDLLDTIRHEFAHLIVGIEQRHNERWRCAAASLGAKPQARGNAESQVLNDKMNDAPFTLIAVMQSGEEKVLRKAHRRSRTYQNYRFDRYGQRYHIDGEWVQHFRYDSNR